MNFLRLQAVRQLHGRSRRERKDRLSCRLLAFSDLLRNQRCRSGQPHSCDGCARSAGSKPHGHDRISLCRWPRRSRRRNRDGICSTESRCDRYRRSYCSSRSQESDLCYTDRVCDRGRPGRNRPCGEPVRPGGNVTGLSNQSADLAGKRLELLRDAPKLRRLAIMFNAGAAIGVLEKDQVQIAARALGLEVVSLEIRETSEIATAIRALKDNADGLYVVTDPLMNTNRVAINIAANDAHLPNMHGERAYVEAGGLISYGPDFSDLFRRCAELVDKVLRGAKPADIPVEQPTKFDLAINLKTAKALDLNVPQALLATANQVVE